MLCWGHAIADFNAAGNCRFFVTPLKVTVLQHDISSIPLHNFKDYHVVKFDLTSMQDTIEKCHHPELVRNSLRFVLYFTFSLEHVPF